MPVAERLIDVLQLSDYLSGPVSFFSGQMTSLLGLYQAREEGREGGREGKPNLSDL